MTQRKRQTILHPRKERRKGRKARKPRLKSGRVAVVAVVAAVAVVAERNHPSANRLRNQLLRSSSV